MNHYHDTGTATTKQLPVYEDAAKKQDEIVLDFFKRNPGNGFSPFEVWDTLIELGWLDAKVPLTSIRRAITNLTKMGKLAKCDRGKLERLGRGNHVWMLPRKYEQAKLF